MDKKLRRLSADHVGRDTLSFIVIAFIAVSILYGIASAIFHTNNLSAWALIVILGLGVGVLILSFTVLRKIILFPIHKLIGWMEIEIIDELKKA